MHLEVNLSDIWKINIFLFKFLQIGKNNSTPPKEFKMESIQLDSVWNKKIPFPTAVRSVISNLVLISTDYLKICIRNKFTYIEIQIPSCFISVLKNETKPTLYSNYWISLTFRMPKMKLKGAVYEYIQTAVLLEILHNINFIMKFIHKDDHSIIIEVLLFDLVRKLWPKKKKHFD